MARFDRLPPEVYALIIEHLEPDDVIPFSLVCRKLYVLSKDRIVRHVELQDIYAEIRIDQDHHPLTLLYAIRKNPEIAYYIKHVEWHGVDDPLKVLPAGPLTVGHTKETIPVGPWLPDDIRTFMPDLRAGLHHTGPYLIPWSQFRQQLSEGNVNACFLLLLFHLPRLVRLRFSCPTFDAHLWHRMLAAWNDAFDPALVEKNPMLENARNPSPDSPYPHRVSRPSLQVVEALDDETDPNRLSFSPLTAFTALSSVRALRVKDATEMYKPYSLAWQTEPAVYSTFRGGVEDISDCGSEAADDDEGIVEDEPSAALANMVATPFNVRAIEITDSDISASTLQELLVNCPHLTSFKMSFAWFDGHGSASWHDLPCLVETLEHNFSKTLTALSLVHPFDYGSTPQIKSFKAFPALKWLEVSLATLLPQETWREKEAWLMRSAGKVPRLIDVLPESLEELVIGTEISPQALSRERLLAGWPCVSSPTRSTFPKVSATDDVSSPVTRLLGSRSAFDYFQPTTDGKCTTDSRNGSAVIESGYSWRQDLAQQAMRLDVGDDNKRKSMAGEWEREWARQRAADAPPEEPESRKDSLESMAWRPFPSAPPAAKRPKLQVTGAGYEGSNATRNPGIEHEFPAVEMAMNFLFPPADPQSQPIVAETYADLRGRISGKLEGDNDEYQPHYHPLPALSRLSIENDATPTGLPLPLPDQLTPFPVHATTPVPSKPELPRLARISTTPSSGSPATPSSDTRPPGLAHRLRNISYFCCSSPAARCDCLDSATKLTIEDGIFLGLDIRRKEMSGGWAPSHEVGWDNKCGSASGVSAWSDGGLSGEGSNSGVESPGMDS